MKEKHISHHDTSDITHKSHTAEKRDFQFATSNDDNHENDKRAGRGGGEATAKQQQQQRVENICVRRPALIMMTMMFLCTLTWFAHGRLAVMMM